MNNKENSTGDIKSLIINYLTNSISEEELNALKLWVEANEQNKTFFNTQKNAWFVSGFDKSKSLPDVDNTLRRLKFRISTKSDRRRELMKGKRIYHYIYLAASWLIFFAIGAAVNLKKVPEDSYRAPSPVKIIAPLGASSKITLPDGSRVWLNAGTELTYNNDFGQRERMIYLTGEAYFDVAKDKEHPFKVSASMITISALGTQFNVKAYPEEETITTTLVAGKIDIELKKPVNNVRKVTLSPSEKYVYYKPDDEEGKHHEIAEKKQKDSSGSSNKSLLRKNEILANVNTRVATSWKDERWIIESEPLSCLIPVLERRFDHIILLKDEDLKGYLFRGTIKNNETLEQILEALSFAAPLDYELRRDTVFLELNYRHKEQFRRILNTRE